MAFEVGSILTKWSGDASSYLRMLADAQAATEKVSAVIDAVANRIKGVSDNLNTFAGGISKALSGIAGNVDLGASFQSFDDALVKSTVIMDKMTDEVRAKMGAVALDLATKGVTGPTELAKAYYYLASAGKNAEQSMAALPVIQRFAQAGAFDMAQATEYAAGAQAALGMSSQNAARDLANLSKITDVLTKVSKISLGSTKEYAQALVTDAGASMRSLNIDLEQGVAVLAAYGQQNIKAHLAGSSYGRTLRLLNQAAIKNADAHKQLGFSIFDSSGKMKNMADIAEQLEIMLAGVNDEARANILEFLGFKSLTQRAFIPIVGMSKQIREFQATLKGAGGTAEKIAGAQMASFASQMERLKNMVTVVAIEIGGYLAPALQLVGSIIADGIKWWRSLDDETRRAAVAAGIFVGAIAGIGPAMAVLRIAAPLLLSIFSPLSLIAGVLGGTAIMAFWEPLKKGAANAWAYVQEQGAGVIAWLKDAMTVMGVVVASSGKFAAAVWDSVSQVMSPLVDRVKEFSVASASWASDFVVRNRSAIATLLSFAAAIAGVILAVKALGVALTITAGVLAFFKVQQAISIGLWLIWKAAVMTAMIATLLFKAQLILYTVVVAAVVIAVNAYTVATAVAGAATTLWKIALIVLNSVLTVTNILIAGIIALAAAGTLAALGAAFVVAAAAVWGVWKAGTALFDVLLSLPLASGPIKHIGGLFSEWGGIIGDVVRAAKINMDLAWEIMAAGGTLAVSQLKDLWPPLWDFIRDGFKALWNLVTATFKAGFDEAIAYLLSSLGQSIRLATLAMAPLLNPYQTMSLLQGASDVEASLARMKAAAVKTREEAITATRAQLTSAITSFKVTEGAGTQAAREALQALQDELDLQEYWDSLFPPDVAKKVENAADEAGKKTGQAFAGAATRELKRFDAALVGSAEAFTRISEYLDMLEFGAPSKKKKAGLTLVPGTKEASQIVNDAAQVGTDAGDAFARAFGAAIGATGSFSLRNEFATPWNQNALTVRKRIISVLGEGGDRAEKLRDAADEASKAVSHIVPTATNPLKQGLLSDEVFRKLRQLRDPIGTLRDDLRKTRVDLMTEQARKDLARLRADLKPYSNEQEKTRLSLAAIAAGASVARILDRAPPSHSLRGGGLDIALSDDVQAIAADTGRKYRAIRTRTKKELRQAETSWMEHALMEYRWVRDLFRGDSAGTGRPGGGLDLRISDDAVEMGRKYRAIRTKVRSNVLQGGGLPIRISDDIAAAQEQVIEAVQEQVYEAVQSAGVNLSSEAIPQLRVPDLQDLPGPGDIQAVQQEILPGAGDGGPIVDLLTEIRDLLQQQLDNPPIELDELGL